MTRVELDDMTVAQLRKMAGGQGVVGASRMRKEDLVDLIAQALGLPGPSAVEPLRLDLEERTVMQLRREALDRGVRGAARMNKETLVELLLPLLDGQQSATSGAAQEPAPVAVAPVEPGYVFPESYGVDRVVLLTRDPDWLYAYWDISGDTWASLIQRGVTHPGKGWTRVLRLYDVTAAGNGQEPRLLGDLELDEAAREHYFKAPAADRYYLVEFGYRAANGEFLLIARSNLVQVPRKQPSDVVDERWGTLYEDAFRLSLAGSDPRRAALGSADLTRTLEGFLAEGLSSSMFLQQAVATP